MTSSRTRPRHHSPPPRTRSRLAQEKIAPATFSVDGDDLLTPVDAARLAHQLLGALAEVHQAGLIHGTLCPSDIVLAPDHRGERWATLLDFGVPESITDGGGDRLARWSFLVPAYAAPEQYGGLSDSRVDLYACGVILFRAITGKLPFGGRRLEKTITSEALSSPQMAVLADDVRKEVTRIVVRALEADPTERFQSASEFAGDLRTLLDRTTSPK